MTTKYTQLDIENLIRESGLKLTDHRLNILFKISKSRVPIAVHKLIEDLQKKYNIDQATVYRNLASLLEAGLLRRYDYNHGHAHYELATEEAANQMICNSCETIEKIPGIVFDDSLKKMVRKSKKFNSTSHTVVEVYGYCKSCSK